MNIEEAKANIGAEVVLLEDTKPYMYKSKKSVANSFAKNTVLKIHTVANDSVLIHTKNFTTAIVNPEHIALKEPKMQNYKIKVANEAESEEAQELLFKLGYKWSGGRKNYKYLEDDLLFAEQNKAITHSDNIEIFNSSENQEITLPQLRDLAVLHRNNVSDATHKSDFVGHKFFVASNGKAYEFNENKWQPKMCKSFLEPITQEEQMTWQDAFQALKDGKEVEGFSGESWINLNKITVASIKKARAFRLTPQRKELNGNFTKEELLKIAGEMV